MKVGIYNPSTGAGHSLGGSESVVAVLAEILAQSHQVDIIHHNPSLTKEQLTELSGADLRRVHLRSLPTHDVMRSSRNPLLRRKARLLDVDLSKPYDLFINSIHHVPVFCHAPRGGLFIHFPFSNPVYLLPELQLGIKLPWRLLKRAWGHWTLWRRSRGHWEWQKEMDSYQLKMVNSEFTRGWTKRWWGIDCEVIYPPVATNFQQRAKTNRILSVGRFTSRGVLKRQLEMATAFQQVQEECLPDWQYICAGGLGDFAGDQAYVESVRKVLAAGDRSAAAVLVNVERNKLRELYEQAKIFWHATGYGEDEAAYPELTEHFGIVTVEAMAAGCVPIVINKGAQPEIVQHGVNGFLWNTLEELQEYTALVARDEALCRQLSEAARARARFFSREQFAERFLRSLQPIL